MDWIFLLLAGMSGLMFTSGDIFLKYWSMQAGHWMFGLGLLSYTFAATFLAYSFKRKEIALTVAVLLCFNLITVALLGWWLFDEAPGLKEIIGMSMALGAIVLINI